MKKKMLLSLCVATLSIATSVQAIELKAPNVNSLKNPASVVSKPATSLTVSEAKGMISDINTKLNAADVSLQSAFTSLASALSSKEELTKLKNQLKAIETNKNLSETEKSAKLTAIVSDYGKKLEETKEKLAQEIKNASAEKNDSLIDAINKLEDVGNQYLNIATNCTPVVMQISKDPKLSVTLAPEVTKLKNTAILLKNNAKTLKSVTTQAIAVAKAGGINIEAAKQKASKAKKVNLK